MRHCHSFIQTAGYRHDYKKELLFHKFWNVLESYQQKDSSPQLFCNFRFRKTFVEKRYNLFSHWELEWRSREAFQVRKHGQTHFVTSSNVQLTTTIVRYSNQIWLFKSRLNSRSPFFDFNFNFRSSNEEQILILNNKTKSWFLGKTLDLVWL